MSDPKQERLKALRLFAGADQKALEHLASAVDEVTVKAGHELIRAGHHHSEMYVLASGSAIVEIEGDQVADIPAGEFVGELAFFNRTAATATVTTAEESDIMVIPFNRFDQILNDNPQLVRAIAAELADRLHVANQQLGD